MALFKPTYGQIINKINEENGENTISSRYSVVLAAAKRARQIVDGAKTFEGDGREDKPLSIAVEEIYKGDVRILSAEAEEE